MNPLPQTPCTQTEQQLRSHSLMELSASWTIHRSSSGLHMWVKNLPSQFQIPKTVWSSLPPLRSPYLPANDYENKWKGELSYVFIESNGNNAKSEVGPAPIPASKLTTPSCLSSRNALTSILPSLYLSYLLFFLSIPFTMKRKRLCTILLQKRAVLWQSSSLITIMRVLNDYRKRNWFSVVIHV